MDKQTTTVVFENTLLSKFECPVCFKYMNPPIRLCLSGHSYCETCFNKLKNCALCRANKSPYRCVTLEQIHASLTFPCRYLDQGCGFSGKGDLMTSHQEYCEFSLVLCPLRFNNCDWEGLRSDIMDHCSNLHPENVFFLNEQKLKVKNFPSIIQRHYYILIFVHDNLFRCSWDLNEENGLMRFAVYYLGRPCTDKKFLFKITVFDKNTKEEAINLIGPCYPLKNDSRRFLEKKYLSTNHDLVKDFCDTNGDFNYSISILNPNSTAADRVPDIVAKKSETEI